MVYCQNCGSELEEGQQFCSRCGTQQGIPQPVTNPAASSNTAPPPDISEKSGLVALLLWFFLGVFGAHYFYVGRIGMGLLWLCTFGCFGIGLIVDLVLILTSNFKDDLGKVVKLDI